MSEIIVIGGGLAGCTAALELARAGRRVTIVEKGAELGGKTRGYGCKSDGECTDCGVCLTRGVFEDAESSEKITVLTNMRPADCSGQKGGFTLTVEGGGRSLELKAAYILLATGFDEPDRSGVRIDGSDNGRIHDGTEMEALFKKARYSGIFEEPPQSAAFVQCFGSRTTADKAPYCSRVCCGYSTRMARALRHAYPDCAVDMFYMDMQEVESCDYIQKLTAAGISMKRCRVSRIYAETARCRVWYEDDGGQESASYDRVILCGGIRPNRDNEALAGMFMLDVDNNGFIQPVDALTGSGIIPIGCASAPEGINRTIALAKHTANAVLAEQEASK